MPRLKVVDPKTATGKVKELFDGPLKAKQINIMKGIANSPAALQAYVGMSSALAGGLLSLKEREIIMLVVGEKNDCQYCLAAHTAVAKNAGLTEEQTIEFRRGNGIQDEKLDALMDFVGAIHETKGFIEDWQLESFMKVGYTEAHVVEVIANYALAIYTNIFNHVNDTEIDFPPAPEIY